MNKGRRARLRHASSVIQTAKQMIAAVADEEQEAFDNLGIRSLHGRSGLQCGGIGLFIEYCVNDLGLLLKDIDQVIERIEYITRVL